ncbi:HNH endonuclease [Brachybacterium halotolerans subsp. kimchii]|nr:HNH endonuclease [Brachybacterium halotolerans subsp. kimchii]
MSPDGYGIVTTGGKSIGAHRLAYLLHHGELPPGMQVDHTCYNRACIEPAHLRLATRSENQWNQSGNSSSTGYRNVYRARGGGYYVQIRHEGRKVSFGSYSNLAEAAEAAQRGREELFGGFAGRG